MHRPWIISKLVVFAITVAAGVYAIVADGFGFYPLSWPMPNESFFNHRLGECVVLWVVGCGAAVWVRHWRKRPPPRDAAYWPLVIVPTLAGAWVSLPEWYGLWHDGSWRSPTLGWVSLALAMYPLLMGTIGSAFLWMHFWVVLRMSHAGVCHCCGYDLRSNQSNRCPECGLQMDEDGTARMPVSPTSCPEILLFETAPQRDAAVETVQRELRGIRILLGPLVALGIMLIWKYTGGVWAWVVMILGLVVVYADVWRLFRQRRRRLREILRENGIRVCMKCGQDLREVTGRECAQCGNPESGPAPPPGPTA